MKSCLIAFSFLAATAIALPALAQSPPKLVIAHRGACGYLPEHTLPGVALAYAMGADYLEPDLVLSKDGVPVVIHDIHVDTVSDVAKRFPDRKRADGRYYAIDFTLAELKQLRVSERFDPATGKAVYGGRFPVGQGAFQIPTLAEEIELIQGLNKSTGRNTGIYPEVKAPAWHKEQGQDISKVVVETLWRYGYRTKADKCYLQCFDFKETKRLRNELGWQGKLVQLITENADKESDTDYEQLMTPAGLDEVAKIADGIGPWINQIVTDKKEGKYVYNDLVKNAHARKLEVHPYTFRADALPKYVASFDELLELAFVELGVDGLFTDFPDKGVAFVRRLSRRSRGAR